MQVDKSILKSMHGMASRAIDALNNGNTDSALDQIEALEVMLDTLHFEAEINDQGDEA